MAESRNGKLFRGKAVQFAKERAEEADSAVGRPRVGLWVSQEKRDAATCLRLINARSSPTLRLRMRVTAIHAVPRGTMQWTRTSLCFPRPPKNNEQQQIDCKQLILNMKFVMFHVEQLCQDGERAYVSFRESASNPSSRSLCSMLSSGYSARLNLPLISRFNISDIVQSRIASGCLTALSANADSISRRECLGVCLSQIHLNFPLHRWITSAS